MKGNHMKVEHIACLAADSNRARQGFELLNSRYEFVPVQDADVLIALGGDGFMLETMHAQMDTGIPVYGMNRGTVGFLMNNFKDIDLHHRLETAIFQKIYPLRMTVRSADGNTHQSLAFNEVALIRYSQQSANLRIWVNGSVRLDKLICDGILVATPAGITAYNLSAYGPVIPIGANVLALTPVSPFRPRRWQGALLPHSAVVEFEVLDPEKRPVGASADSHEVKNALTETVQEDRTKWISLMFDEGHSLEERIVREQFAF
jgi:NAD+ kinase